MTRRLHRALSWPVIAGIVGALGLALAPVAAADTVGLQPDGSVLALVTIEDQGFSQVLVADIRPDGTVDTGFGQLGALRRLDPGSRLATLPDGSIRLLSDRHYCPQFGEFCGRALWIDSFSGDGEPQGGSTVDLSEFIEPAVAVDLTAPAGELIALTSASVGFLRGSGGATDFEWELDRGGLIPPSRVLAMDGDALVVGDGGLGRVRRDGPPAGYGEDGFVSTAPLHPRAATLLGGGAVAVAGTVVSPGTANVVRVLPDGTLDPSFAGDGRAEVDAGVRRLRPEEIAALPGGSMLVAGTTSSGPGDFALARLTASGALDTAYGAGGLSVTDFGGRDDRLHGLVTFGDGSAIAVGTSRPAGGAAGATQLALVRLRADGTPDDEFGDAGLARIAFDVVPPEVAIEQAPEEGSTMPPAVTVGGSSPDPDAVVECTLDGVTQPCATPATFSPIAHGVHLLTVRATDASGNRRELQRRFDVEPDTAPVDGPPAVSGSTAASFVFSSATGAPSFPNETRFSCRLDAAQAWTPCTSPWTVQDLTEGEHTVEVRGEAWIYAPGFERYFLSRKIFEADPARHRWRIDRRAPLTSVQSAPPPRTEATSAAVAFAADEPGASSECRLDGGEWLPCTSPVSYAGLGLGAHDLRIRSTDGVGNLESPGAHALWEVVAPRAAVVAPETLTERRAAARAGLAVRVAGTRRSVRRGGLPVSIRSAVGALVHVRGTVAVRGSRRRVRLRSLDTRVEPGRDSRVRLRFPKAARVLARKAGRRALVVRLTVTLADADVELATRRLRLEVPR